MSLIVLRNVKRQKQYSYGTSFRNRFLHIPQWTPLLVNSSTRLKNKEDKKQNKEYPPICVKKGSSFVFFPLSTIYFTPLFSKFLNVPYSLLIPLQLPIYSSLYLSQNRIYTLEYPLRILFKPVRDPLFARKYRFDEFYDDDEDEDDEDGEEKQNRKSSKVQLYNTVSNVNFWQNVERKAIYRTNIIPFSNLIKCYRETFQRFVPMSAV